MLYSLRLTRYSVTTEYVFSSDESGKPTLGQSHLHFFRWRAIAAPVPSWKSFEEKFVFMPFANALQKNIPDLSHAIGVSAFWHISYQSIFCWGDPLYQWCWGGHFLFGPGSIKQGTGADNGPGVFNDFDFNHSSLICLKLWRRDDSVVLPSIRNGVFVPRYARNWFIDHWILLGQIICKCGFGKRNERRRVVLFFFSLHGWVLRLRLLTLAASLARLPFKSALWLQR